MCASNPDFVLTGASPMASSDNGIHYDLCFVFFFFSFSLACVVHVLDISKYHYGCYCVHIGSLESSLNQEHKIKYGSKACQHL